MAINHHRMKLRMACWDIWEGQLRLVSPSGDANGDIYFTNNASINE